MNADLPKTSASGGAPFRLGDLEIHPASHEIRGRGRVTRVRPLLMEVLLRLARAPGEVVRRETLLEDVWPRRMVNDEVLSRAIAELRTALGDDARVARYIETIPKTGYRIVAPVAALEAGSPAAVPATPSSPRRTAWLLGAAVGITALAAALAWIGMRPAPKAPAEDLEKLLAAARPLTSDPGLEVDPRFSPDARSVAYALGEGAQSRIYIHALDGGARRAVTPAGALVLSPAFFPGGERIAYWKRAGSDCGIYALDLRTQAETRLVDCALEPRARFDLSRDGRELVFTGNTRPSYPAGLWVVSLDGGTPRTLTAPDPGMGEDLFPRFSPDGKRVAFYRGSESHRRPWIVETASPGGARAVGTSEGLSYGIAWLGNDGPLVAAADWLGFRALHVLDLASGKARLAGARGARFPDASANGDIVYESAAYSANLWRFDLARGAADAQPLWPSTRYSSQAEFSPDGRRVAFASNREGMDAIYVAEPGGEPRKLLGGERHRYLRPHWSADGRSLYAVRTGFDAAGAPLQHGVRVALDSGVEEVLAALGTAVNAVVESRDGRSLYVGEIAGHAMRLLRASADGAVAPERLALPLVSEFRLNATHLVFTQPQLPVLTACRLDTLACEPFGVEVPALDTYHWALGPRSLFVRQREGDGATLARYDLASRRLVARLPIVASGAGASLAVAPDESALLVAREQGPAIDLMVARR